MILPTKGSGHDRNHPAEARRTSRRTCRPGRRPSRRTPGRRAGRTPRTVRRRLQAAHRVGVPFHIRHGPDPAQRIRHGHPNSGIHRGGGPGRRLGGRARAPPLPPVTRRGCRGHGRQVVHLAWLRRQPVHRRGRRPGPLRHRRRGRLRLGPRNPQAPPIGSPRRLRRGPPRRHARTRPLPRPDARGPRHGRGPGPRPEHRLRGGYGHLQADGYVVLPARTRRRGRRHVRPDAGREAGLIRRAALLRGQQHLRRPTPALRRGRRALHGRPGALRHAHQPPLGGAGRCHVTRRPGRVPGPGPRRVPVRPDLRQPREARPSVRHGTLAVRLRPADRRHDRRLR